MVEDALISIRGLIEGGGTPLRKFKGKFVEYNSEPATGYEGTRVNLDFTEMEVIQSTEPYHLPTAVINLGLSNKKKSKWGYFSDSLALFIPPEEDLKQQIGKVFGMVFTDGLDGRPAPETTMIWNRDSDREVYPDGMVPTPVFIVYELEGAVAKPEGGIESANDILLKELIGKTRAEFNKVAFTLDCVRANPALQRAITDKSFITGMASTGKVYEDANGVFQAGPEPAAA